jgi:hypothetical protein
MTEFQIGYEKALQQQSCFFHHYNNPNSELTFIFESFVRLLAPCPILKLSVLSNLSTKRSFELLSTQFFVQISCNNYYTHYNHFIWFFKGTERTLFQSYYLCHKNVQFLPLILYIDTNLTLPFFFVNMGH